MNDFLVAWRNVWLPILGNDGKFYVYFDNAAVWSIDYVTFTSYAFFVIAVIWLSTLSVRLLRKMICGVVR